MSREGERRQDAGMHVRLVPVVGMGLLSYRAVCAWSCCIGCRCPVVWWEFLQANGHDQPGLTAFTGHDDVSSRRGSQRSGRDVPDDLRVARPGVVDVIGEGKHLLKRCHHIGDMGVGARSFFIPVRSMGYDHFEQVVGMIDGVSFWCLQGYFLSLRAVACCATAS